MTNNESIDHYYDGGPPAGGTNYGVYFSNDPNNSQALAIVATTSGGTGNFCNNPSGNTIMYFLTGNAAIMNVPAGFTTGFSFYYSTAQPMTINVYDGLEGSGNLLMTANYPAQNNVGCTCNTYCNWTPVGVSFAGTARSVAFVGAANYCGFDDVTFGSATPGNGGTIPTVSQWGLIILGFLFLAIGTIVILRWRGASA